MRRVARRGMALLVAALMLASCGNWKGIANVPIPGGPGAGPNAKTIYVQMPDTLALYVNSRVQVANVEVGTVRGIEVKNWVAILTLGLKPDVKLPANATAKIGQTSLLGSQHVELAAPDNPSPEPLKDGDTIPLKNSSAFPTTERVLAALFTILRGGGIPNLEVIQNEINNVVSGRADQIREFLNKLDTFTDELNRQRDGITRAIDSTSRLLAIVAENNTTVDRVLTEFPPLIQHFADTRGLFDDAVEALGRISGAADGALGPASDNLHTNLQLLQRTLRELGKAAAAAAGWYVGCHWPGGPVGRAADAARTPPPRRRTNRVYRRNAVSAIEISSAPDLPWCCSRRRWPVVRLVESIARVMPSRCRFNSSVNVSTC